MENLLYEYMTRRIKAESSAHGSQREIGPVITISRQGGCGASRLAHELCQVLNTSPIKKENQSVWQFINHEILEKSAEKLNLEPQKLDRVITDKDRGIMDEILEALSTHSHKSDKKIMNTVQNVIKQFAEDGNYVIVGRGGAMLSQHIRKALHIRLEAPLNWRIEQIVKKLGYSREYAATYLKAVDERREMYVSHTEVHAGSQGYYDAVLDPSRFSEKELIESIIALAKVKNVI
ncbi:MAG: cytidylate kinase-like family protein [Bacteroidales bacterium]|nr:cytidylate kinase-like family protein [Bacteroidales bacterium]